MRLAPLRVISSLTLLLALGSGCEGGHTVLVDLRTDLVAGEEFQGIRTELTRGTSPVGLEETLSTFGTDYVTGERIFEGSGLEAGDYRVTVRLLDASGAVVAQRRTSVNVAGDVAFTTVIKRDSRTCDMTTCESGETCGLDGCTDERCSPETGSDLCPPADCATAGDCVMRDACSETVCVFGRCLYGSIDDACAGDEWCDPDNGCLRRSGPMPDSGSDGGSDADAGGCAPGTADCDGNPANGCEQDVATDPRNCGTCGMRCDGAGGSSPTCSAGICGLDCPAGRGNCDGDASNGCETDVTTDSMHCALCGSTCPVGLPLCVDSDCIPNPFPSDGSEGAFAPSADMTLSAGVHMFDTIDIPSGVTITVDGSGVLELYAAGDVVIDGTVDLTGGAGGLSAGGGQFQNGGGGDTGTGVAGMPGDAAMCRPGGSGGLGSNGGDSTASCGDGGRRGGGAGGGSGGGGGGGGAAGGAGGQGRGNVGGNGGSLAGNTAGVGTTAVDGMGTGAEPGLPLYGGGDGGRDSADNVSSGGGGSIGMDAVTDLSMETTFRPGSGGGGGGGVDWGGNQSSGTGGGGGGGALRIASATSITVGASAELLAIGGAGASEAGVRGHGGGGSGGAIYLAAPTLTVMGNIDTAGGLGGTGRANGGNGGLGRIRLSALAASCSVAGSLNPPMMATCADPTDAPGFTFVGAYPD